MPEEQTNHTEEYVPSKARIPKFLISGVFCALLSIFVLPGVVGLILNAIVVRRTVRTRRYGAAILASALCIACVLGPVFGVIAYEGLQYGIGTSYHAVTLSTAVFLYYHDYGAMADTFDVFEATGYYGAIPYHLPANGWEVGTGRRSGPSPHYCPVRDWDGKTRFIVAVVARTPRTGETRSYVLLAEEPASSRANERELAELLVEDDKLREATDQPVRWSEVPWQEMAE